MQRRIAIWSRLKRSMLFATSLLLLLPVFSSLILIALPNDAHAAEPAQWATKGTIVYNGKTYVVTGNSSIYAVPGTQTCSTGSTEVPLEYVFTGLQSQTGVTFNRIDQTKKDATGRLTCQELPTIQLTMSGNPNALFYRQGDSVFDYTKRFEFKKTAAAGPGGAEVFIRSTEVGGACPDAIVKDGANWLLFPMATKSWVEGNEVRHGQYAISEKYATFLSNPSYNDGCRVASLEIKNVLNLADWRTGVVTVDDDDYDSCQLKSPSLVEWSKLPGLDDEGDLEVSNSYNWGWNNKDYIVRCDDNSNNGVYYFALVENNIITYIDNFRADGDDAYIIINGVSNVAPSANPNAPPPPLLPGSGDGANETKTSCVIPGIGWILCPIMDLSAKITDGVYAFVSAFLTVQPVTNDAKSGLFTAWSIMRNFANVAFVIVFLIIIISQVTSIGISNYGIKRMLPRLIAAAILVNISFWLCAIAVDLSNIGGSSLKGLFDGIGAGLTLPNTSGSGWAVGNQWQGITASIIGAAAVGIGLYISLSALLPVLAVCLITILILFLALILRQILITLLIVLSPLAFVAFLLPNTEGLFNRWRRMFVTLLVMYPLIAIIFGASALAGKIIAGS